MNTIGELLSDARRRAGKSIKDAEKATKIRTKYLEALESDQLDQIPGGDVYIKGFIRSYAQYLGLDGDSLVGQYKREVRLEPRTEQALQPTVSVGRPSRGLPAWIPIAVGVVVLVMVFWGARSMFTGSRLESVTPPSTSKPKGTTTTLKTLRKPSHVTVKLLATGDGSWVRAIGDKTHELFQATIAHGEARTFTARRTITIRAGNSDGLDVWKDGIYLGVLNPDGGIFERTFKARTK